MENNYRNHECRRLSRLAAFALAAIFSGSVLAFGTDVVEWLTEEDIAPYEAEYIGNAGAIEMGKSVYGNTCLFCHGGDGRGARAPTLTTNGFAPDGPNDNVYLVNTILNGREGTIMGAFKEILTEEEIWQVIAYLRYLSDEYAAEQ